MVEEYCWLATLQASNSKRRRHSDAALGQGKLPAATACPACSARAQAGCTARHGHVAAVHHIAATDAQQCSHAYVLSTSPPIGPVVSTNTASLLKLDDSGGPAPFHATTVT